MRRLAAPVVVLFVAVAFAGCLDDAKGIFVPASDVPDGWEHAEVNETTEAAGGNIDIVVNRYDHGGRFQGNVWGIGVTDVPFVDEAKTLRKEVQNRAASTGVQLEKTGEDRVTLDNGRSVKRTTYDITKDTEFGNAAGKAWFLSWDAGFTAGAFGYATTEASSLIGSDSSEELWQEVQAMLLAVDW